MLKLNTVECLIDQNKKIMHFTTEKMEDEGDVRIYFVVQKWDKTDKNFLLIRSNIEKFFGYF